MSIADLLQAASSTRGLNRSSSVPSNEPEDQPSRFASLLHSLTDGTGAERAAAGEARESSPRTRLEAQLELAASVVRESDIAVKLGEVQVQAEAALRNWQEYLEQKLGEKGIQLNEPLRLLVKPGDGRIVVQGEHPRKVEIESILNEDQPLADSIRGISAMFDLLRAADQHQQFRQAYEEDPVAAVQTFSYLFDEETNWPVELRIDEFGGQVMS